MQLSLGIFALSPVRSATLQSLSTFRMGQMPLSYSNLRSSRSHGTTFSRDLVVLQAVQSSSIAKMQTLLDSGLHVDHQMDKIGPPLVVAIWKNDQRMVDFLLHSGADPNGMSWLPPVTFLATAAALPSQGILAALLEHGARVAQSGALHAAAEAGNIASAERLLSKGADVNEINRLEIWDDERDNVGTALHAAAQQGEHGMVSFLLHHGADRRPENGDGLTALGIACREGNAEVTKILQEYP